MRWCACALTTLLLVLPSCSTAAPTVHSGWHSAARSVLTFSAHTVHPKVAPIATAPSETPEQSWLTSRLARCVKRAESGDKAYPDGDYTRQSAELFGGAWQFSVTSWTGIGGKGLPYLATPAEQDYRAWLLFSQYGWSQWQTAAGCGA